MLIGLRKLQCAQLECAQIRCAQMTNAQITCAQKVTTLKCYAFFAKTILLLLECTTYMHCILLKICVFITKPLAYYTCLSCELSFTSILSLRTLKSYTVKGDF